MQREVKISLSLEPINKQKIENYDLGEDLYVKDIDKDLSPHMNDLSGSFAYWGSLKALADNKKSENQNAYKIWIAGKKKEVCEGAKFTSETAKEEAVIVKYTQEYGEWQKKLADAEYDYNLLSIVCEAWKMKKDMLISIGADQRADWANTIGIKDKAVALQDKLVTDLSKV